MIGAISSNLDVKGMGVNKNENNGNSQVSQKSKAATGSNDGMFRPEDLQDQELDRLVEEINSGISSVSNDIQLQFDRERNEVVFRIVNSMTQELVRQIPSEEVLQMREKLSDIQGLLFENEA